MFAVNASTAQVVWVFCDARINETMYASIRLTSVRVRLPNLKIVPIVPVIILKKEQEGWSRMGATLHFYAKLTWKEHSNYDYKSESYGAQDDEYFTKPPKDGRRKFRLFQNFWSLLLESTPVRFQSANFFRGLRKGTSNRRSRARGRWEFHIGNSLFIGLTCDEKRKLLWTWYQGISGKTSYKHTCLIFRNNRVGPNTSSTGGVASWSRPLLLVGHIRTTSC